MTQNAGRTWMSRFAAAAVLGAVTFLPASTAWAHSDVVESTPADGAELSQAPTQVELKFDEAVQQQGGTIVVSIGDTSVSDAATFVAEGNVATVQLKGSAQPGSYTVKYRIVSADGHVGSGTFGYSVTGTASASSSPAANGAPAQGADESGDSGNTGDSTGTVVWVLGLGAIGIVLVAAIISVAVRGRRDRSD